MLVLLHLDQLVAQAPRSVALRCRDGGEARLEAGDEHRQCALHDRRAGGDPLRHERVRKPLRETGRGRLGLHCDEGGLPDRGGLNVGEQRRGGGPQIQVPDHRRRDLVGGDQARGRQDVGGRIARAVLNRQLREHGVVGLRGARLEQGLGLVPARGDVHVDHCGGDGENRA